MYFGFWALVGKLSLALAAGLALPLVRLLGYSTDRDEAILVYEFLEGGSLDTWLFQGECF